MAKPLVWTLSEHPSEHDKKHAIAELIFTLSLSVILIVTYEILYAINHDLIFNKNVPEYIAAPDPHFMFSTIFKASAGGSGMIKNPAWGKIGYQHLTPTGYVMGGLIIFSELLDIALLILWLINLKVSRMTKITFIIIVGETSLSMFYWIMLMLFGYDNKDWLTVIKTISTVGLGTSIGLVVMMYHRVSNHIFI